MLNFTKSSHNTYIYHTYIIYIIIHTAETSTQCSKMYKSVKSGKLKPYDGEFAWDIHMSISSKHNIIHNNIRSHNQMIAVDMWQFQWGISVNDPGRNVYWDFDRKIKSQFSNITKTLIIKWKINYTLPFLNIAMKKFVKCMEIRCTHINMGIIFHCRRNKLCKWMLVLKASVLECAIASHFTCVWYTAFIVKSWHCVRRDEETEQKNKTTKPHA